MKQIKTYANINEIDKCQIKQFTWGSLIQHTRHHIQQRAREQHYHAQHMK